MKLLIDVNLAPSLARSLEEAGVTATHWTELGDQSATDVEILSRARNEGYVVVTRDLDFGDLLAVSLDQLPSVIQIRIEDVLHEDLVRMLTRLIEDHRQAILAGALVSVDEKGFRARLLPLRDEPE